MPNYALVNKQTGYVDNVIVADSPEGFETDDVEAIEVTDETGPASLGGTWDGEKFGPNPNTPPLG